MTKVLVNFIISALVIILSSNIRSGRKDRIFFNEGFRPDFIQTIKKTVIQFHDTLPDDTLNIGYAANGLPCAIFRNITTGVCLDGECRVVNIRIYWTITGKYLGYSLAEGQELTKREHVAFSDEEYELFHKILNDSVSLLKYYNLQEIQPVKGIKMKTDGISGATAPNLSGYIVPEAAFTSLTIWHLVYGSTRDSIEQWSRQNISPPLLDSLMDNHNRYDQLWAINNLRQLEFPCRFAPKVFELISSSNYLVTKQAIYFLEGCSLPDSIIQQKIAGLMQGDNPETRYLARDYFKRHKPVPASVNYMAGLLQTADANLVHLVLTLFENCSLTKPQVNTIAKLLERKTEIAWRAYTFLSGRKDRDAWLDRKLKHFERKLHNNSNN
jgi:hypothetical protein